VAAVMAMPPMAKRAQVIASPGRPSQGVATAEPVPTQELLATSQGRHPALLLLLILIVLAPAT